MDITSVGFVDGKVIFWYLDFLDPNIPISQQLDELDEDLALIKYSEELALDIGWYPAFSPDGQFAIAVIARDDWESPLVQIKFRDPKLLIAAIKFAQTLIGEKGRASA